LLTPKFLANSGIAGATIPKPRATENATAVRTATSGGRDPKGLRRARIRAPIFAGRGDGRYAVHPCDRQGRDELCELELSPGGSQASTGVSLAGSIKQLLDFT